VRRNRLRHNLISLTVAMRAVALGVVALGRHKRLRRWLAVLTPMVLLTALVVVAFRTHRFVTHDQRFCSESCHIPKNGSGAWHTRGHQDADCGSCHTTSLATGYSLLWKEMIHSKNVPKHGAVKSAECTSCHEKNPVEWREIQATEGHRAHLGAKNVDCISCHGENAHDAEASTEKLCLNCHDASRLHRAVANAETCLSCHSFAVSTRLSQQPTATGCKGCHADPTKAAQLASGAPMKAIDAQAIHGRLDCKLCHDPHGHKPAIPEGQPVCARCHQIQQQSAGALDAGVAEETAGSAGHKDCLGCHEPHAPRNTALKSCARCHEKNARGLAEPPTAAMLAGIPPNPLRTQSSALKHESCTSCHLPHTWRAEQNGCVTCHEDKALLLLTRSPPQHDACTTCHDVHGPPPTGAVCLSCHSKTKGRHVALAPPSHKDCASCHDPHQPSPADTRPVCVKCHLTQATDVLHGPERHARQSCFGCHKPHENPMPAPNLCAKCHTGEATLVATAGPELHRSCTSCHATHQFAIKDVAAACTSCHGSSRAKAPEAGIVDLEAGPHKGDCKTCHTLHGPPGVPKAACFKCHDKVEAGFKPPNEQHGACKSCHEPHLPASAAVGRCAACHTGEASVAVAWPAVSAHAQACNGCHTPHDVSTKKPCASCHQKEAASAFSGKHKCVQCHAPHQAPPGTGPAWWSRCSSCHAGKVETVKHEGPTHSDCKNCHEPHAFGIPACTLCHNDIGGKGLHAVTQHAAKCDACHDPHVKADPTRAQCLACHTEKRQHEPNAEKCDACHPFR
jgi:hypothetical protein